MGGGNAENPGMGVGHVPCSGEARTHWRRGRGAAQEIFAGSNARSRDLSAYLESVLFFLKEIRCPARSLLWS